MMIKIGKYKLYNSSNMKIPAFPFYVSEMKNISFDDSALYQFSSGEILDLFVLHHNQDVFLIFQRQLEPLFFTLKINGNIESVLNNLDDFNYIVNIHTLELQRIV